MSGTAVLACADPTPPKVRAFSLFERWPGWLFYAPVLAHWIWHGLRAGDMTLPTAANPMIETGGLCGESKSAILDSVREGSRGLIAPYVVFVTGSKDWPAAERAVARFGWPLVVKPDIGCNGAGVRLVHDQTRLEQSLAAFPRGVRLMVQAFVPDPGEAGIFYIRHPDKSYGRITSLTLKSSPTVTGDGRSTLHALLLAHPRAGKTPHLFVPHLQERLTEVPAAGIAVPLVFTGNHCRGSVFRDGAHAITADLTRQIDALARDIPGFHFGRIDVRFRSEEELRAGSGVKVIEINGVGSEATHIWDPTCSLADAYAAQFTHYRAAWEIGRAMRGRGTPSTGLRALYRAWNRQRRLMASYPPND